MEQLINMVMGVSITEIPPLIVEDMMMSTSFREPCAVRVVIINAMTNTHLLFKQKEKA